MAGIIKAVFLKAKSPQICEQLKSENSTSKQTNQKQPQVFLVWVCL